MEIFPAYRNVVERAEIKSQFSCIPLSLFLFCLHWGWDNGAEPCRPPLNIIDTSAYVIIHRATCLLLRRVYNFLKRLQRLENAVGGYRSGIAGSYLFQVKVNVNSPTPPLFKERSFASSAGILRPFQPKSLVDCQTPTDGSDRHFLPFKKIPSFPFIFYAYIHTRLPCFTFNFYFQINVSNKLNRYKSGGERTKETDVSDETRPVAKNRDESLRRLCFPR